MSNYHPYWAVNQSTWLLAFLAGPPENDCQNYRVVPPALAEHTEMLFTSSETLQLQYSNCSQ